MLQRLPTWSLLDSTSIHVKAFAPPQVLYDVGPSQMDQLYPLFYESAVHYPRYFIHGSQGVSCIPPPLRDELALNLATY